jgi:hypothetical protein
MLYLEVCHVDDPHVAILAQDRALACAATLSALHRFWGGLGDWAQATRMRAAHHDDAGALETGPKQPAGGPPIMMMRKRARSLSESSGQSYEDVIANAINDCEQYGVQWEHLENGTGGRAQRVEALKTIKALVVLTNISNWYLGVARNPARRFHEDPCPHCLKYHVLYPLGIGTNMGRYERNLLRVLRGPGGEHVSANSVCFMYCCIRRTTADESSVATFRAQFAR